MIEPLYSGIPRPGRREPSLVAGAVTGGTNTHYARFEERKPSRPEARLGLKANLRPFFFLYEVPPARWRLGMRPTQITVFAQNGRVEGVGHLMYENAR